MKESKGFTHLPEGWRCAILDFLRWIYDHSGSEASWQSYESHLRQFFADKSDPGTVTRQEVIAFMRRPSTSLRNQGATVKASTQNRRLVCIASLYKFASACYDTAGAPLFEKMSPCAGLRYLQAEQPNRAMSEEEVTAFFNAIDRESPQSKRDYCIFLVGFLTARRRSEVLGLRWKDIQATTLVDPNGTRRQGYTYTCHPKAHKRESITCELPQMAYESIVSYLRAWDRLDSIQPEDFLFRAFWPTQGRHSPVEDTNTPLAGDYVNARFKAILRKAGLDTERLSMHSLRHASATARWHAGEDLRSLSRVLGHSALSTTDKYIARITGNADPGAKLLEAKFAHLAK